jgi:transcriptional regulator with XRE-family HTH domain
MAVQGIIRRLASKGMTAINMATKAGITKQYLYFLLRGKRTASDRTFERLGELELN